MILVFLYYFFSFRSSSSVRLPEASCGITSGVRSPPCAPQSIKFWPQPSRDLCVSEMVLGQHTISGLNSTKNFFVPGYCRTRYLSNTLLCTVSQLRPMLHVKSLGSNGCQIEACGGGCKRISTFYTAVFYSWCTRSDMHIFEVGLCKRVLNIILLFVFYYFSTC